VSDFGFSGNDDNASGQLFATNSPAAGDVPVANADGSFTWTAQSDLTPGGVTISGTPAAGDLLAATSSTAATWATPLAAVEKAFTAKGDIIIGTGAGTGAILSLGSSTDVLTVGGVGSTGVEWAAS